MHKLYDFLKAKYLLFTYQVWDKKFHVGLYIPCPMYLSVPWWFIVSVFYLILVYPWRFIFRKEEG